MNLKKFFNTPTHEPFRDKKAERNLFARRTLVAFFGDSALNRRVIHQYLSATDC
ncbi:transpeptidase involved in peptidoglycan synthesis (penicillin-binding protein 2) [Haemophilus influenzae]|uniref:Transpeptidase involved in peptidoglycan synthesis (Penicillin-binding protein 2) n=1 Tax=Haemophilus influenzae TaxID=727 RepID=A0A2X1PQJ2_HAEIF|nr:transpeptidase involved in peptidoglycan synthesis (penicillin-binding protein 2) [Haemophilus influenzae]